MRNQPNSQKASVDISPLTYEEVRKQIKAMLPGPVELDDQRNLIELGLDSLQIMRMVNKWRRDGSKVTFAELIAAPRLSAWWPLINNSLKLQAANEQEKAIGPEETEGPFSLTDVQYAYWVGRRDDQPLGGVGCHAYLELDGRDVEPERLESAWGQLLRHHAMLRAGFLDNGQQEILAAPFSPPLLVHDLRLYPEGELLPELNRIRDRLTHRRLAVEKGEVAGLELSLLPGGHTRLHFDIDLLVADVQSLQIILRDLAAAYARGCRPAAPVNWSFAEYLRQTAQQRVSDQETARQYWKQRLASLPGAPGLPLKEKPASIKTSVFKRRTYFVKEADWALFQKRAAAHKVTTAMVLLTAYAEILERWSTTSRFLINVPLFDRQTGESGLEDVVADFTNLLLLAVDCSSRQSFLERVRSIQTQFHQDVAQAAYSGIQLQRDLARLRPGERDFAPVVFACNIGAPLINEECRETLGKLAYMISQTPQVWLDFQLYELDGGLLLAWDAVECLFPDGMLDQMFAAYTQLINWLAVDNNDWQTSADLLLPSVERRGTREVELAIPQSGQGLHSSFFEYAAEHPQAIALIDSSSDRSFSYGELSKYALQVAAFLAEEGIKAGDPVAVTLPRGKEQIGAVLGILAMGACYVPVSIEQPLARRDRIHKKAAIRWVLTDYAQALTKDWPAGTSVLDIAAAANSTPWAEPVELSSGDLAYIIFTSGSTGEPKGVEISHSGAWNTISDLNRRYKVGSTDRILAVSALDFDLSVYDIFGLLSVGGSLVLITEDTRRDAAHWLKMLDKYQVTIWNSVPVLLDMLLVAAESKEQRNLSLRLAMLSGDWIGLDLPVRLKSAAEHCQLIAMGGATEASIWSNYFEVALPLPQNWTSIPYGRPLTNQAYRVVDGKGRDCPDWVAGELWIGGAGVAQGYRGDPQLTGERFVNRNGSRWYRTGDLGRYWPDGTLEFLGREDFQVKIRGHRIELGEIETALKQHPSVCAAVVTAAGDPRGNKQLVGYVVPAQEDESPFWAIDRADAKETEALWTAVVKAGRRQSWQSLPQEINPEDCAVFWEHLEGLSTHYIGRALQKAGAFLKPGERYTLETLLRHCGIQPRYRELVKRWLGILENAGLLEKDATQALMNTQLFPAEPAGALKAGRAYPAWEKQTRGLLSYLQQIDKYSSGLLKGDIDPLELFFSAELFLSPDDLRQTLPGADYINGIARKVMETVLQELPGFKALRVLEIGARSNNLTEALLSLLAPGQAIYTCTDQSSFFTQAAKNKFQDYPFVQYQLLDLDHDPQDQGYEAHSYDVIIAANSLHRARNIGTALEHIQSLLAPGGLLLLLEMTRNSPLQQISTAFLEEGFTRWEDERQAEGLPLLSASSWQEVLESKKFAEIALFPEAGYPTNIFGQHVLVAQGPRHVKRLQPEKLIAFLSQKLPEYMVPLAYIPLNELPLTANGKVDRQALPVPENLRKAKPEKARTVPRTALEQELAAIWGRILEIERIGVNDSFFQLGGDSLLATKLSALIRNKLEIELSLGSIFAGPTIAELAECVQTLLAEKAKNSGSGFGSGSDVRLPQIVPAPEQWYLPFPLTDIQQAYWIGRSGVYALGNVATHCYFEIEGIDLDLERISKAWQRLIDQHGIMRAVILPDGQHQLILERVPPYRIEILDLRGKSPGDTEVGLNGIRAEMSHQVLAAHQWPLFDVRASRFGEKQVRLHISFDNLLFDGWSMFHLLSEWTRLYHDPDGPLPSLELSFRDYVMALEGLKQSDFYQRDQEYWFNRLSDLPPAPELPLAQNPESLSHQRFSRRDAKLNRDTWQRLKKRSAEVGLTPSGILLTAYAEVLAVWSRRPRFTINLTQFNRLPLHPQVPEIIGDFTSLTLLAVDNSLGKSFLERSRNLQRQLWQDLDHPYVGGVEVQRELAKKSAEHQGMAMPIVFTSALGVDQWNEDGSGGKWLGKLVYNITQTPQVWLDHQVVEQDGELLLIWDAVEGLFPGNLLDEMFAAYCRLLQRLADEEAAWREIAPSLVAVPGLERRIEANQTAKPVSLDTLPSLFVKRAARQLAQPAVISPGRTLTYEELLVRSNDLGILLREKGVQPNTLVAVLMEKGWEQVVAVMGVLMSGAAYLPIDPVNPEERRRHLLRDGDIGLALTQSWLGERLNWPEDVERLYVDQLRRRDREFTPPELVGKAEDLAYVIYTSGSTGFPKGVMIDQRGAVNTIQDVNRRFSVGKKDRILALANLNFDLSVYDIFGILAAGAAIILPEADKAKDPAHWLELMKQEQVTVWNSVPALMQMLLEYASGRDEELPQDLRLVLLSGDWIPLDLPGQIKARFKDAQVIGLGGATEASIWSNLYLILEIDPGWKSIPYGRPLFNQRYHVLNELLGDCPTWVPGQLYIGGIGLAKGYWKDETRSREKFIIHPRTGERLYRTGDLGRYWPDGNLEFLGREDFQVKIRGQRIELGEIETALKRQEGVKDAVVAVSGESRKLGESGESREEKHLVGYVVLEQEKGGDLYEKGADLCEIERADPAGSAARRRAITSAGQLQAAQIPTAFDLEGISAFMEYAEQLSLQLMGDTLYGLGIFREAGERYSLDQLMFRCKLHPRYRTLLIHWLNALKEEGLLEKTASGHYLNRQSLNEGIADFAQRCKPDLAPDLVKVALELEEFFRRDSSAYMSLLKGELDPRELFLREDSFLTPEVLSRFNLTGEYYSDLASQVFSAIINSYPADQEMRVLEIGTRAGSLTGTLVSLLPGGRSRYLYTDESSFFTERARRKWGESAPLAYSLLDMNKAPFRQGYEPHSFEVIVADNTLHRSRNIATTLKYLKEMLVPGGFLFCLEPTRNRRLMLTSTGFFEDGFSHFEDERKTDHLPLITAEKWGEALERQGFSGFMPFPESGQAADEFGQHLLVAQAPEVVRVFKPANLSAALGRSLPDYMVPTSYVLLDEIPLSVNGKVDRNALADLGRAKASLPRKTQVAPFTATQVKIAEVWKRVLGCENVGIHDGFFELGGDSLRAIQCLNLLKERYRLDLSLQNLFEAPNIELLARIIERGVPAAEESDKQAEDYEKDYEEGII